MRAIACALIGALALAAGMATAAGSDMPPMHGMPTAPAARHGHGSGVITAIDPKAGSVTIRHGPIPGVGWPAMTMTFKATPPSLLSGIKPGDKVAFSVRVGDGDNQVTAIARQ
jgi:Cu(I)/Ag(I) efflux system protein CusF